MNRVRHKNQNAESARCEDFCPYAGMNFIATNAMSCDIALLRALKLTQSS